MKCARFEGGVLRFGGRLSAVRSAGGAVGVWVLLWRYVVEAVGAGAGDKVD